MTPWELVKASEHSHQRALFAWANCAAQYGFTVADDPRGYVKTERDKWFKDWWNVGPTPVLELHRLFAIHNQGHGDAVRGARAKAEGVKAGVPDIMLPVARRFYDSAGPSLMAHGLFIELKRPKAKTVAKGTESGSQKGWRYFLINQGYHSVICVGWLEAVAAIKDYLK